MGFLPVPTWLLLYVVVPVVANLSGGWTLRRIAANLFVSDFYALIYGTVRCHRPLCVLKAQPGCSSFLVRQRTEWRRKQSARKNKKMNTRLIPGRDCSCAHTSEPDLQVSKLPSAVLSPFQQKIMSTLYCLSLSNWVFWTNNDANHDHDIDKLYACAISVQSVYTISPHSNRVHK